MQEPIAAPAWSRYVTRPPFRLPCGLLAERAAGDGFRRRHGELCPRVLSWSGFLTYRCSATTLLVISHHQSYGRHGARHKLLAHVPGASFWPSCRKRLHSVKRGVECTSGAVRARTKFEETRELEEEPLTMPSLSVDMEHFRPYSSHWDGVFAT